LFGFGSVPVLVLVLVSRSEFPVLGVSFLVSSLSSKKVEFCRKELGLMESSQAT
jgi:hypothetical protein